MRRVQRALRVIRVLIRDCLHLKLDRTVILDIIALLELNILLKTRALQELILMIFLLLPSDLVLLAQNDSLVQKVQML